MTDTCETVTIETENGPVDINKSDYDENIHNLAGESKAELKEGSKPWLIEQLKAADVDFDGSLNKAELKALFDGLEIGE